MKAKAPHCYFKDIIHVLMSLQHKYPTYNMGRHLATALDGCDVWSISDKEMLFQIEKYKARLEYDIYPEEVGSMDDIIRGGMELNKLREELLDANEE